MTHGLNQLEFSYGGFRTTNKAIHMVKTWGETYRVKQGLLSEKATPEYVAWRAQRVNDIVVPFYDHPPVYPKPLNAPSELERVRQGFEEEKAELEKQKQRLREEIERMNEKVQDQDFKIHELSKKQKENEALKIDLDHTFETLTDKAEKYRIDNRRLKNKLERMEDQDLNLRRLDELKNDRQDLQKRLKREREFNIHKSQRISELEQRNQESEQEKLALQTQIMEQDAALERIESEKQALRDQVIEFEAEKRELCATIAKLALELRAQVRTHQITMKDYERIEKVMNEYKTEYEKLQDNYIFETLENMKIKLTRDVWRFEYREERAQREHLEKQLRKAMTKAAEMAQRTSALLGEIYPRDPYGQSLINFLEESLDQYRRAKHFFSFTVAKKAKMYRFKAN